MQLGNMERFNIIRNHLHMYNSVHVSAKYTIPSPSTLLPSQTPADFQSLIFSCLAEVLKSQPILGVTIQDEGTKTPRWQRLSQINFTEIVKFVNEDPEECPDKWLEAGLRERLDRVDELPVWRVIVAIKFSTLSSSSPSSPLIFSLAFFGHHVIADGISCGAFHTTFLSALNQHISSSPSPLKINNIVPVPKIPLVHSLEEGTSFPLTIVFILVILFKEFIYNPVDPLSWSGPIISSSIPTQPPVVRLRSFSLSPTQVAALVAKCREKQATVTSLITALVARQLGQMYPSYKHFTAGIPFSVRKFTGHGPQDMGVLVSSVIPHFSSEPRPSRGYISCAIAHHSVKSDEFLGDEMLWESAKNTKDLIRRKTASPKNQAVAMLSFASDMGGLFLKKLGGRREAAFEVTNITTLDGGLLADINTSDKEVETNKAYFDKAWFCGGLSTYAAPYVVSVVTVKGGWMNVCVTFEEGVLSEDEGHAMISVLEMGLKEISGVWKM
jgi:hypothetical protein